MYSKKKILQVILFTINYFLSRRVINKAFLTPRLGFDDLQLCSGSGLVVFSDLTAHAETQSHHVVLLAVTRQTTLDVVQQSRLQSDVLHTHVRYGSEITCHLLSQDHRND